MKKITALFPDNVELDFSFLSKAVELKMETIPDMPVVALSKNHPHHRGPNGETMSQVVCAHYTPEGIFTSDHARAWITLKGYAATSTGYVLGRLKKDGLIRDLGAYKYQWLKQPSVGYK